MYRSAKATKSLSFILTASGLLLMVLAAVGLAGRYLPITNQVLLVGATLSPYLMMTGLLAPVIFSCTRRWVLAAISVPLAVAIVLILAPRYVGDSHPVGDHVALRVMTANIYEGQADPRAVVDTAIQRADVLSVQELTPESAEKFSAAGLDTVFPYRVLDARGAASGTGLWSRYPITDSRILHDYVHTMVLARLRMPGVAVDPTVFAAHLPAPVASYLDEWNRELAELPEVLRDIAAAAGPGCVVVAGDLNSTADMKPFGGLVTNGYSDAAEQAGSGINPTYPADRRLLPPFASIDHVLTRRCPATSVQVIDLPGSDHRGLVAEILVPASGPA